MSNLVLGINAVSMDEACWCLKELIGPSADSKSARRWQIITVLRNDKFAELRRDLGPADHFASDEFVIPGGVYDPATGHGELLETVGELVDIADLLRSPHYQRPERPHGIDLVQHYRDLPDKQRRRRRAVTQFGYGATTQRS